MSKLCKWCNTTKDITDFHKHKQMADGHLNKCKDCVVKAVAEWRIKTPDCRKEEHRKNREKKGFLTREDYYKKKAENAIGRKASALKYAHKRRSATKKEMSEFDTFAIEEAIELRDLRKQATGFDWHVDHIVPFLHKDACGLHVAANIQVVPAYFNVRKGNRHMQMWDYK